VTTQANTVAFASSQWRETYTITDKPNGQPIDLTGLTWTFVIRPNVTDTTVPALVLVTTTPSMQGQIDVTPLQGIVTVTLTPAVITLLGKGARPYALRSNTGLTTETLWVEGVFNSQLAALA
jgi:hypothetical protein